MAREAVHLSRAEAIRARSSTTRRACHGSEEFQRAGWLGREDSGSTSKTCCSSKATAGYGSSWPKGTRMMKYTEPYKTKDFDV